MAQLEIIVGKPHIKESNLSQGEVTGFIELVGPKHSGSLAITFNKDALLLVYQNMLGETLESLDESTLDLAGEITNMVCGGAKQRLSEKGMDFDLTRPSMLSGTAHQVSHKGKGPVLSLPLALDQGQMFIEVCLNH
jgi:chemotaxis protein CheX